MRTSYARISDLTGRARHSEQGARIVCTHIRSDLYGAFLWAECAQAQLARLHAISRNVAVLRSCGSPAAQAALMPNALRSAAALTELFCGCAMPAVCTDVPAKRALRICEGDPLSIYTVPSAAPPALHRHSALDLEILNYHNSFKFAKSLSGFTQARYNGDVWRCAPGRMP